ncbi:putative histone deacetylase [Rosa chinensis]|uniref:Putative histone deacetylase n=1 Tax=Rosa chinensis TaxID=74649 RepID=A0A2P6QB21_ROSCH|nr:putative histone deacetylase [Rosa chinensis]
MVSDHQLLSPLNPSAVGTNDLQTIRMRWISLYSISVLDVVVYWHPFDSAKWGWVCRFLSMDDVVDKNCIVEPKEAAKEDLVKHT